ncbi:2-oxoglutarate (2OG) and Fe(II)-dependent oxygenase superfamily protein [Forsythia ovata]|uniref:2-oxoglutarate (2OG) and Fe(II)-dependent oxygenase superfamily protein n=1 Tax=Forsythia ovata TaxID=205694 RepID=A0ABD1PY67_9LAMI
MAMASASASQKVLLLDLASNINHVPTNYIRPISDRPNLDQVDSIDDSIPLIDLHSLTSSNHVVQQIGQACKDYGFFQVKNHGIPDEVITNMMQISREFFRMPQSERMKSYSDDPSKTTRLSTSFNVKTEKVSNWRDFLRLHCYPLDQYLHEWPSSPSSFRDNAAEYCRHVRQLALTLLEIISESLGLEKDYINRALDKHGQHMALNYYPPCPQPELTYGLPGHTDPNVITILLQDDVPGLQVLNNDKWLAVNPIPHTFIVNIGDQIQVLSNDRYKSVLHRAVVNCYTERISIPTFYCPSPEAIIAPAPELIDKDHPCQYRSFTYSEYYQKFWNRGLATETCLDLFRSNSCVASREPNSTTPNNFPPPTTIVITPPPPTKATTSPISIESTRETQLNNSPTTRNDWQIPLHITFVPQPQQLNLLPP